MKNNYYTIIKENVHYKTVLNRIHSHKESWFEFIRREGNLSVIDALKAYYPFTRIFSDSILSFILTKYSISKIGWVLHRFWKRGGNK